MWYASGMDIRIPELPDGDAIVVKNFEPDQWPERPLGMTFHVYVSRTVRFLFWTYRERYPNSEYPGDVVYFENVGAEGLQKAVDNVAALYFERRERRAEVAALQVR